MSTEPKRILVYTEYGYAYVDVEQFRAQLQRLAEQSAEMQASIKEYFIAQYTQAEAEQNAANAAEEKAKAEAAEAAKAKEKAEAAATVTENAAAA